MMVNVNVRKGAGTSYPSLGVVRANARVTYLRTAKGWSNVKTSKGTGWISNRYLDTHGQHPVAVYGTLCKGKSAYHLLRGVNEATTRVPSFNMYLKPDQTWWSFIIQSSASARSVVVERMDIRSANYRATLADLDKWERFDPRKPLAEQNYNRKLVTDKDGKRSWAYVGASKISNYLIKNGIRVTSGDYLRRS
ncbi:SH3 domain-containing protein [Paeniglutamicibacter sp.]|uniref:SH3 domain-containing protein n=1 Tax=Paeniglutamicibacter sp. TaxID=1934391 RepID=UPI003988CC81